MRDEYSLLMLSETVMSPSSATDLVVEIYYSRVFAYSVSNKFTSVFRQCRRTKCVLVYRIERNPAAYTVAQTTAKKLIARSLLTLLARICMKIPMSRITSHPLIRHSVGTSCLSKSVEMRRFRRIKPKPVGCSQ